MTAIPEQKHNDDELNQLRMRNAFAVRPPVEHIRKQAVHPLFLGVAYVLCLVSAGLLLKKMLVSAMICGAVVLLVSLLIYWRKPRSQHHAVMMAIISLLVLVFGSVYYYEQFEQTPHDAQGPTRH